MPKRRAPSHSALLLLNEGLQQMLPEHLLMRCTQTVLPGRFEGFFGFGGELVDLHKNLLVRGRLISRDVDNDAGDGQALTPLAYARTTRRQEQRMCRCAYPR